MLAFVLQGARRLASKGRPLDQQPFLILGAGLTGLSAAHHFGEGARVLESLSQVGGKARTRERQGARFDITGHWLHLRDPYMLEWVPKLPGLTLQKHDRKARIFSHGVYTLYPFQANTFGLPPTVARECLQGFVDARLHDLESGIAPRQRPEPETFEDWILQKFGAGIAEHFMVPYNQKIWTAHPRELSARWCDRYIPVPKVEDVIAGAVGASREALGYNAHFLYPPSGRGIQELADAVHRNTDAPIELEVKVTAIDLANKRVQRADGRWEHYQTLLTSLPLPVAIDLAAQVAPLPEAVAEARSRLQSTFVAHLDVLAKGSNHDQKGPWDGDGQPHWTYFPEARFPFYRVGSFSAVEPNMTDGDTRNFYVEFAHRGGFDPMDQFDAVAAGLSDAGLIDGPDAIIDCWGESIAHAYVLNDEHHGAARDLLVDWLASHSVLSAGRYGNWEYSAMEDALLHGRRAAAWARERLG